MRTISTLGEGRCAGPDALQKGDARGSADRRVATGQGQQAALPVDTKRGDLVAALIARI
jgi:hypothetical protein